MVLPLTAGIHAQILDVLQSQVERLRKLRLGRERLRQARYATSSSSAELNTQSLLIFLQPCLTLRGLFVWLGVLTACLLI